MRIPAAARCRAADDSPSRRGRAMGKKPVADVAGRPTTPVASATAQPNWPSNTNPPQWPNTDLKPAPTTNGGSAPTAQTNVNFPASTQNSAPVAKSPAPTAFAATTDPQGWNS